jgi:hypothetical protein
MFFTVRRWHRVVEGLYYKLISIRTTLIFQTGQLNDYRKLTHLIISSTYYLVHRTYLNPG